MLEATAGRRYHSLDRNVLGLFLGFTYTHALFLTNPVNRSKVCNLPNLLSFTERNYYSFLRVAIAALWWSQKEIYITLVSVVLSSFELLKQA